MPKSPAERPLAALMAPDILDLLEEAPSTIAAETEELHPADLAEVAELIPRDKVKALLAALPKERAADVLEYLDEELRTEFLEEIPTAQAAVLVSQMTPDDRTDVLEEMDEEVAEEIVSELPKEAREETERLLQHEPNTAGGLMTTEFVSVSRTYKLTRHWKRCGHWPGRDAARRRTTFTRPIAKDDWRGCCRSGSCWRRRLARRYRTWRGPRW